MMKLRPRMIQFDRDPRTGQYAANAPLPSPRAMQAAYGQGGATATRNVPLPNEREIARAAGIAPLRKYARPLGAVARGETHSIAAAVAQFLAKNTR